MTDDDKALVERLRYHGMTVSGHSDLCLAAASRIEALSAENERLREALREVTPPPHFGESEQSKAWWTKSREVLGDTK